MLALEPALEESEEETAFADIWVGDGLLELPIRMNLKSIS